MKKITRTRNTNANTNPLTYEDKELCALELLGKAIADLLTKKEKETN